MAHFAKLDENNNVIGIHVLHNDVLLDNGKESEQKGIDFLTNLHKHIKWKQTSYNTRGNVHILGGTPFRKNFAENGGTYNTIYDAFISPRPTDLQGNIWNSWKVNVVSGTFLWESPLGLKPEGPNANTCYFWFETRYQEDNTKGWVLHFWDSEDGKTGNIIEVK